MKIIGMLEAAELCTSLFRKAKLSTVIKIFFRLSHLTLLLHFLPSSKSQNPVVHCIKLNTAL